jgi:hypothetical protein
MTKQIDTPKWRSVPSHPLELTRYRCGEGHEAPWVALHTDGRWAWTGQVDATGRRAYGYAATRAEAERLALGEPASEWTPQFTGDRYTDYRHPSGAMIRHVPSFSTPPWVYWTAAMCQQRQGGLRASTREEAERRALEVAVKTPRPAPAIVAETEQARRVKMYETFREAVTSGSLRAPHGMTLRHDRVEGRGNGCGIVTELTDGRRRAREIWPWQHGHDAPPVVRVAEWMAGVEARWDREDGRARREGRVKP